MALFSHLTPEDKTLSDYIHNILGYRPKNIALYHLAFTHRSKSEETVGNYHLSNERLEYLGDAVLELVVGDFLFHTYPTQPEGFLTEMRSRIVSRVSLNKLAKKLGLDEYIKYQPIQKFADGSFRSLGGNAFEALMGAIYLDKGFDFAQRTIIDHILRVHIDLEQLQQTEVNFKSKLLQITQKQRQTLEFRLLDESMEDHRKVFHVRIFIDNKGYGECSDYSLKRAEQIAAEKTLQILTN